jgi:DNA-directed RNA polymerase sigma subunit (sigma70/sigma32)
MRKLYFAFLQWLNDGEPSRQEVQHLLKTHYRFYATRSNNQRKRAMILNYYAMGYTPTDIAKAFKCTRERVRQIIRKALEMHKY